MFTRRQRIILASAIVLVGTMLVLVAAYAQCQGNNSDNPPMATKATFDANGVGRCPAGYMLDYNYPAASACRLKVHNPGKNGACQSGYGRQDDGNCQLESVGADQKGQCPDTSVFDRSTKRCKVCSKRPKNPSKRCNGRDFDGDCNDQQCG